MDNFEDEEQNIEILVDTLRQCFLADKARYHIAGNEDALLIEIQGLEELTQDEITEVSEPILSELTLDFEEIIMVPLKAS